ncbi:MAG: glycosyltransferase family 2 protein [Stagnimonas sp.]|nr:glycosyltransferase family 2 protein [Stagnimonas sp.]
MTKNEQQDLPGCMQSVSWSDDIHLYDSFSDDRTVEIAQSFNAKVTQRHFDNWSAHQNWGLRNIQFKHPWVFYIDADERMTPELVDSIRACVAAPGDAVAFRVRRRDFLLGTWLRHVQASPYYIRLFRPEHMRYERLTHPVSIVDGAVGSVSGFLDHHPFSKGSLQWIGRHIAYADLESRQVVDELASDSRPSVWGALTARDFHVRRRQQKQIFYRLPFRPLVKFLLLYLGKRGFLDGRAGFQYAVLQSFYEYMIVLKTRELQAAKA